MLSLFLRSLSTRHSPSPTNLVSLFISSSNFKFCSYLQRLCARMYHLRCIVLFLLLKVSGLLFYLDSKICLYNIDWCSHVYFWLYYMKCILSIMKQLWKERKIKKDVMYTKEPNKHNATKERNKEHWLVKIYNIGNFCGVNMRRYVNL